MLSAVSEKAQEMLPLSRSAYSSLSSLFIGESIIQPSEGVEQGDPILFCLTTLDIIGELRFELCVVVFE